MDGFTFPEETIRTTSWWVNAWSQMWRGETPSKMHGRDFDEGGAPEWTPEFKHWIDRGAEEGGVDDYGRKLRERRNPDPRLRTTRAFRKLRKKNPREFEVLYRTVVMRSSLEETATWLTERAIRNDKPERYTPSDAQILLVCAVELALRWW
jgi:hypothetical protein